MSGVISFCGVFFFLFLLYFARALLKQAFLTKNIVLNRTQSTEVGVEDEMPDHKKMHWSPPADLGQPQL